MNRDQRVEDNWALLHAQDLALSSKSRFIVYYNINDWGKSKKYEQFTSLRHYEFIISGLKKIEKELTLLNINFYVTTGNVVSNLLDIVKHNNVNCVISDFNPIDIYKKQQEDFISKSGDIIDLFQVVDAHNIVPCWLASDKREYAARTIRPKIHNVLYEYLTEFPKVIKCDLSNNFIKEVKKYF